MEKYKIIIREVLKKIVEIDAESYEEAVDEVQTDYYDQKIILGADDWVGTTIK